MDYEVGRRLIEEVNLRVRRDSLIYRHRWAPGDMMVWDNRCLLHRATPYGTPRERRLMRRWPVIGDEPR